MVLVFAIWLVLWYFGSGSEVKTRLADSFGQPEFLPYLLWYLAPECVVVVGLLLGSIAGASVREDTPYLRKLD
jgi:hypothetical protein